MEMITITTNIEVGVGGIEHEIELYIPLKSPK
jgi:hypothetical protein